MAAGKTCGQLKYAQAFVCLTNVHKILYIYRQKCAQLKKKTLKIFSVWIASYAHQSFLMVKH